LQVDAALGQFHSAAFGSYAILFGNIRPASRARELQVAIDREGDPANYQAIAERSLALITQAQGRSTWYLHNVSSEPHCCPSPF